MTIKNDVDFKNVAEKSKVIFHVCLGFKRKFTYIVWINCRTKRRQYVIRDHKKTESSYENVADKHK